MKTDTMFFVGGCSGSFPAVTGRVTRFDLEKPNCVSRQEYRRDQFGGNTSSYLLRHKDTFIVIDQGSGIKAVSGLVLDMLGDRASEATVHILQTHFHEDHVNGIQQNDLLYTKGLRVVFHCPDLKDGGEAALRKVLADYFGHPYFPVDLKMLDTIGATREFQPFHPMDKFQIDEVQVDTFHLRHPGGCAGYRFKMPGCAPIVLATDFEPSASDEKGSDFPLAEGMFVLLACEGAGLVLTDIQYRQSERDGHRAIGRKKMPRRGWGHGTPETVLPLLQACEKKPQKVRVVHHDPERSDIELQQFGEEIDILRAEMEIETDLAMCREGDIYWL